MVSSTTHLLPCYCAHPPMQPAARPAGGGGLLPDLPPPHAGRLGEYGAPRLLQLDCCKVVPGPTEAWRPTGSRKPLRCAFNTVPCVPFCPLQGIGSIQETQEVCLHCHSIAKRPVSAGCWHAAHLGVACARAAHSSANTSARQQAVQAAARCFPQPSSDTSCTCADARLLRQAQRDLRHRADQG